MRELGRRTLRFQYPFIYVYSWTSWAGESALPSALVPASYCLSSAHSCRIALAVLPLYSYHLESRQGTCPWDRTFPEGEPSWGFPSMCSSFLVSSYSLEINYFFLLRKRLEGLQEISRKHVVKRTSVLPNVTWVFVFLIQGTQRLRLWSPGVQLSHSGTRLRALVFNRFLVFSLEATGKSQGNIPLFLSVFNGEELASVQE